MVLSLLQWKMRLCSSGELFWHHFPFYSCTLRTGNVKRVGWLFKLNCSIKIKQLYCSVCCQRIMTPAQRYLPLSEKCQIRKFVSENNLRKWESMRNMSAPKIQWLRCKPDTIRQLTKWYHLTSRPWKQASSFTSVREAFSLTGLRLRTIRRVESLCS